jgi:hypothetical protein
MDAREQRGIEIAARFRIVRRERDWSVPSQTGEGRYTVSGLDAETARCTCGASPLPASSAHAPARP